MAVKFTNDKKWDDVWFSQLTMEEKVMFMYLCDKCDIAGFFEVNKVLATLQTGIKDVDETIKVLSKSVIYRDGYVWIKKYIKHQKNLPINTRNGAHKAIIKCIEEQISRFPEVYETLPVSDSAIIKSELMGGEGGGASPPPLSRGISIGTSISNTVTADTPENESLIARLYKYFVGEENLMVEGITTGTRKILAEAIHIMDVEKWRIYCEARLNAEFKAAPNKFFLEDGWRRYQDSVDVKNKEKKKDESLRKKVEERRDLPQVEAPKEFKEFVKNFGKRSRKTETAPDTAS